jgi:hypothetical protein
MSAIGMHAMAVFVTAQGSGAAHRPASAPESDIPAPRSPLV